MSDTVTSLRHARACAVVRAEFGAPADFMERLPGAWERHRERLEAALPAERRQALFELLGEGRTLVDFAREVVASPMHTEFNEELRYGAWLRRMADALGVELEEKNDA